MLNSLRTADVFPVVAERSDDPKYVCRSEATMQGPYRKYGVKLAYFFDFCYSANQPYKFETSPVSFLTPLLSLQMWKALHLASLVPVI